MVSKAIAEFGRPKFLDTVLLGGLTAGVLDGMDAVLFYSLVDGVKPTVLFQFIASGLLGMKSFNGGWRTVALGIALHFVVALGAAAFYYAASFQFPAVLRRPFLYGPAFGLGLYFFMQRVVIPLSAVQPRTTGVPLVELLDQLLSHTLFVGLPIALLARTSSQRAARVGPASS
jgi:uncharacterized membrane protein YagU involved in acid resistance